MEQRTKCGNIAGWTRIATVNITRGDECPTVWNKSSQDGISFSRSPSNDLGCYHIIFSSKGINFQKVCGMARGYQKGGPDAFHNDNIDGLSITHGNPCHHIWSYGIGFLDAPSHIQSSNCPCATAPSQQPNSFIGQSYYCETGVSSN